MPSKGTIHLCEFLSLSVFTKPEIETDAAKVYEQLVSECSVDSGLQGLVDLIAPEVRQRGESSLTDARCPGGDETWACGFWVSRVAVRGWLLSFWER